MAALLPLMVLAAATASNGQVSATPAVGPVSQPANAADQAPGGSIQASLGASFISERLPFDVPFFVTGPAPASASGLELFVYRIARRDSISQITTALQKTYTCVPPDANASLVSQSSWRRGPGATNFSLLVNALDPQRYYVFCFVSSGSVPKTEIEAPLRKSLADVMTASQIGQEDDVTIAQASQIKRGLTQNLERIGQERAQPAVIPPGNIFHPDTVVARRTPWAALVTTLVDSYGRAANFANTYGTRVAAYRALLQTAREQAGGVLTAEVVARLPRLDVTLPPLAQAMTSSTPLDITTFGLAEPVDVLRGLAATTRPTDAAAATAIENAAEALDSVGNAATLYVGRYETLRMAAQQVVDFAALQAQEVTVSLGSSVMGADLARSTYVSLDAGIAYPWRLENLVFYAGTNIYLRAINKAAPLSYKGGFLHRFAFTVGVTTTVKDESRRSTDLRPIPEDEDTSNSLLLGAGLRVTPSIRLGAGALIFKETDPNPTIRQTSVVATPYVSLALDVDVAAVLKSFFP